jgi:hypothetical protein
MAMVGVVIFLLGVEIFAVFLLENFLDILVAFYRLIM